MGKRKFTEWHRSRVIAAYKRTSSIRLAADAARVSPTWAFHLLDGEGLLLNRTPEYPARLAIEAERLYVREKLSCRGVAARLAKSYSPAPSQEWVHTRMKERGVLRTKSQADKIQNGRRNGRDYEVDVPARARELAAKRWSVRRIAAELGVSRNAVKGALAPKDLCSPAEASVRQKWLAEDPAVDERREKRSRVLELRLAKKTYREIKADTGLSFPTIGLYLRDAGLVKKIRRRGSSKRRRPLGLEVYLDHVDDGIATE